MDPQQFPHHQPPAQETNPPPPPYQAPQGASPTPPPWPATQAPPQPATPPPAFPTPFSAPPHPTPSVQAPASGPPFAPSWQSQNPPPSPPKKRGSRGIYLPLTLLTGALVLVTAGVVGVVLLRESDNAKDTATSSPSASSTIDQCLIGTWRTTSVEYDVTGKQLALPEHEHDKEIRVKGQATKGAMYTYEASGRMTEDLGGVEQRAVGPSGQQIRLIFAGQASYGFKVQDGKIHYTGIDSSVILDVYVDGTLTKGYKLEPYLDPSRYSCTEDTLRTNTEDNNGFSTRQRMKD